MNFAEYKTSLEKMIHTALVSQPVGVAKEHYSNLPELMSFYQVAENSRRMGGDLVKPLKILSRILSKLELLSIEYALFRKLWVSRLITILLISIGARVLLVQITKSEEFALISNTGVIVSLIGFGYLAYLGQKMSTFSCWYYENLASTNIAKYWWRALNQDPQNAVLEAFPDLKIYHNLESQRGVDCLDLKLEYLEQFANKQMQLARDQVRNKIDRMPLVELGCMLPLSLLMNIGPILEFNKPF